MCLGSTRHTLFRKMGRQGKEKLAVVLWYCLQIKTCCWCNSFGQPWFLGWNFVKRRHWFFKIGKITLFFFSKTSRQKFHPFLKFVFWGESVTRGLSTGYSCRHCRHNLEKKKLHWRPIHQWPSVSFTGEFSPNFDLKKIWFRPIQQKDFSWKNKWPKFARFWIIIFSTHQIFMISSSRKPRI